MTQSLELDPLVSEFLMESYENLDQLDRDLVMLEEDPDNREMLSRIFRTIHTVKGSSGLLGFVTLEAVTHVGENLLSRLREGELSLNAEITTVLLSLVDAVRQMLANIETISREGDVEYSHLMETMTRLSSGGDGAAPQLLATPAPGVAAEDPGTLAGAAEAPASEEGRTRPDQAERPAEGASADHRSDARALSVADTSIRVDVGLLDRLMDQVGELVLARNQILQFTMNQEERSLIASSQRLDLITTEIQESVMKTRMQPIGTIWNKFPRVVRDLAMECGKKVEIKMEGQETELDKTLIEVIKDPLTHLVRNAVDHGIETPDERRAAGKPETGVLFLRAYHEGGQVNIEITDDGSGINPERVLQKAIERGVVSPQQASQLSQREVLNLIFMPGFSTAEKVTNISGRGVGMDVVKSNIEKINGNIDLQSEVGRGASLKIKIPLTLAIIPALIVQCAGDRYAIPQVSLVELVRLEGEDVSKRIEIVQGSPVYRLRGNLLPLVYLHRELGLEGVLSPSAGEEDARAVNIVVLQADDRQFGVVVEGVNDTEEIVVKPLGKQLKDLAVFAGATTMGDGKVALILDVLGLAQRAQVVSKRRERPTVDMAGRALEQAGERHTLLLFEGAAGEQMALPLARVARLEKFARSEIEQASQREVVQYRGQIMPLIHLSNGFAGGGQYGFHLHEEEANAEERALEVVVHTNRQRSIGLVVGRILDIVEENFTIQDIQSHEGILGTAVIQGKVTELVDLDQVIQMADPSLFAQLTSAAREG